MFKFFIVLLSPSFLLAISVFSNDGKRIYQSITTTIKSSKNIVRSTMDISPILPLNSNEKVLTAKEREIFLKKQFTSKQELLGVKEVKKENISIHQEVLEFFHSLNKYSKKPIDIE